MKENVRINIASSTIIKFILWVAIFAALFYIRDFVVALLVAVVLASAVESPVRIMMRKGISRGWSVSIIFLSIILLLAAFIAIFAPPLIDDFVKLARNLPQMLESVRIFGSDFGLRDLSVYFQDISTNITREQIISVAQNLITGAGGFFATSAAVIGSIFNLLVTFVLAFYLATEERGVQKFLRLIFPKVYEGYVEDLWNRSQTKIGLWMQGQLLLSLIVAVLVYIPLLFFGVPYATLLALLAFFGELVPVVGVFIATVPALLIAYVYGGLPMLGIVSIIYFVVSQLENHYLYPKIMNRMVGVPSVIVLIAVIVGAKFAGIWGVILAVPLASIFMELASDLDKKKNAV